MLVLCRLDVILVLCMYHYLCIIDDGRKIIKHSRKLLSFRNTKAWKKKSKFCFDITMGNHDSVEVCELVEIFILSHLTKIINQNNVELYIDNVLTE